MLLLFKGPYRVAAQLVLGIALLVVGLAAHTTAAIVLGAVLAVWGLFNLVGARRAGRRV
jgi:uncharacterized membrane protein HdeD (DUF308 family)